MGWPHYEDSCMNPMLSRETESTGHIKKYTESFNFEGPAHSYSGWLVPLPAFCKLEAQGTWWNSYSTNPRALGPDVQGGGRHVSGGRFAFFYLAFHLSTQQIRCCYPYWREKIFIWFTYQEVNFFQKHIHGYSHK